MKPTIGKGANSYKVQEEQKSSAVRTFIEINTHHNITIKREYVYIEDVKEAININTLEERIMLKRWLIKQLQASKTTEELINVLFESEEKDRHRLQKDFKISI
jgi:hypothetical protein